MMVDMVVVDMTVDVGMEMMVVVDESMLILTMIYIGVMVLVVEECAADKIDNISMIQHVMIGNNNNNNLSYKHNNRHNNRSNNRSNNNLNNNLHNNNLNCTLVNLR